MNISAFYKSIYEFCEGRLDLRAFATGKPDRRQFVAVDDCQAIERFCAKYRQSNVYFGVGTRDNSGSGCKPNVVEIPALWADVDFKDITPELVKKNLDNFPLRPSTAVLTGHGVHFYWMLKEPATSEDFNIVEDLLRRIRIPMAADPSACEVARVLRVPGTVNVKKQPVLVKIRWLESYRYNLEDFDFLPDAPAKSNTNSGKSINPPGWMVEAFKGVPEGGNDHFAGRDVAATKIAGYFVNSLSDQEINYLIQCWNIRNEPPLDDATLEKIINSISRYKECENGTPNGIRTATIEIPLG